MMAVERSCQMGSALRALTRVLQPRLIATAAALLLLLPLSAGAEDMPKRGGSLEFAVTVEPGN
jgi:hypothetical protein